MKASYETHESVPTPQLPEKKKKECEFQSWQLYVFSGAVIFPQVDRAFRISIYIYVYIYLSVYIYNFNCMFVMRVLYVMFSRRPCLCTWVYLLL